MMVMRNWALKVLAVIAFILALSLSAAAQEDTKTNSGSEIQRRFGSPDQVDNQIAEDKASISRVFERRLVKPYFE